jgi:N-formylglutamate deformylase
MSNDDSIDIDAIHLPGVLRLTPPQSAPMPLVFDSPHSGAQYPHDFKHTLAEADLRRLEDAFVDELYDHVPVHGAALLRALFPRSYIDPNRAADDIDVSMLDEQWPHAANPSQKTKSGIGLLFRHAANGPLYNRKLSVAEVRERLEGYYWPYHQVLERVLEQTHRRHGVVLHINCHSMKSTSTRTSPEGAGSARPDFILGDRDGTACAPRITAQVADHLREQGYEVSVNSPYKGVELVKRYSDPSKHRHSMQIEINRRLYMNERMVAKHDGFDAFKAMLRSLTSAMGGYVGATPAG